MQKKQKNASQSVNLQSLPDDIIKNKILPKLSYRDIMALASASKRFHKLVHESYEIFDDLESYRKAIKDPNKKCFIKKLNLHSYAISGHEELISFFEQLKSLNISILDIDFCYNKVTDELLIKATKSFPDLETITIVWDGEEITDYGLINALKFCPQLRNLNIPYKIHITDQGLKGIKNCPKLEILNLGKLKHISDKGLIEVLNTLPNLKVFNFRVLLN